MRNSFLALGVHKFVDVACGETHTVALTSSFQNNPAFVVHNLTWIGSVDNKSIYLFGSMGNFSSVTPEEINLTGLLSPEEWPANVFAGKDISAFVTNKRRLFTWGVNKCAILILPPWLG